jgi:hypothetical protein
LANSLQGVSREENLQQVEQGPALMEGHGAELPQSDNLNNLQVGMVLLPESLNMDPGLDSLHQGYFPQGGYEPK